MSQYYFNPAPTSMHQQFAAANNIAHSSNAGHHNHHSNNQGHQNHHHHHHGGRSRRSNRYSQSQNSHKQFKTSTRSQKESAEATHLMALRKDYEAARGFDLEDDEIFCPWHLLTEDDLHSIHSTSSDRSSSSGGSPNSSPLQQQPQPTPQFPVAVTTNNQPLQNIYQSGPSAHLKLHQPMAQRTRNAIPIVDPNSRNGSPPDSVSPARRPQQKSATGFYNHARPSRVW